jgi:hypothetical protein
MPDFPTFEHWLPQPPPPARGPAPPYETRHLADDDLATLDARIRDWREERPAGRGGRAWFRHFGGTSVAEATADRRPLGCSGFRSADRPAEAVIHLVGRPPSAAGNRRAPRRAVRGRAGRRRATTIEATCRPDDRIALSFFEALGFAPQAGPGSTRLYGVPAFADWEGDGEDRVLLLRATSG